MHLIKINICIEIIFMFRGFSSSNYSTDPQKLFSYCLRRISIIFLSVVKSKLSKFEQFEFAVTKRLYVSDATQ